MWQPRFDDRLLEWRELREQSKQLDLDQVLVSVDSWWQRAPISNHYLHMDEVEKWPLPWDLLADDIYCDLAKCLGICYTLMLIKHKDIESIRILQLEDFYVVEVNFNYILNYIPNEIVNTNTLPDLKIKRSLSSDNLTID
jgi:hypothetical protein